MNTRIFMDYYHEIDFPSLFARAVESDDDVGTTLRIHLLCERMVEAWICACCDCQDLAWTQGSREWLALETFIDT